MTIFTLAMLAFPIAYLVVLYQVYRSWLAGLESKFNPNIEVEIEHDWKRP